MCSETFITFDKPIFESIMKKCLASLLLFISIAATAQEGPAYTGDYVDYKIMAGTEKITLRLPAGSTISDGGKVIINGKTFAIERLDKNTFFEQLKEEERHGTQSATEALILMRYASYTAIEVKGFNKFNEENPELTKDTRYMYRVLPDSHIAATWYDTPKDGHGTVTTSLNVCTVVGNSIINISLEGPIDHTSSDFQATEALMLEVASSIKKPVTTAP